MEKRQAKYSLRQLLQDIPKDGWVFIGNYIRRRTYQCPITAYDDAPGCDWLIHARKLGLNDTTAGNIMCAADNKLGYKIHPNNIECVKRIRRELIKALNPENSA